MYLCLVVRKYLMTLYEPITLKRIIKIFLWTFFLSPLILLLIAVVISALVKGLAETQNELIELFSHGFEPLLAIGYFGALATILTLIIISSALYHNYKWKQFFHSELVKPLYNHGFKLDHQGLKGFFRGVHFEVSYFKWKGDERSIISIYKQTKSNSKPTVIKDHGLGKNIAMTDYSDALVVDVNIRGRRRRREFNIIELLDMILNFTKTEKMDIKQLPNSASVRL